MSISYMNAVWECADLKGSDLIAMLALANFRNDRTGQCNPSIPTLAAAVRVTERQVVRVLNGLEENGYLTITRGNGRGKQSQYEIDIEKLHQKKGDISIVPDEERVTSESPFSDERVTSGTQKGDIQRSERVTSSAGKDDISDNLSIYKNQLEPKEEPEGEPAREPTAPTVPETKPETPAPIIEDPPVPENTVRITRAQILDARAQLAKAQLPDQMDDPPSKAQLRAMAAQSQLPYVPPPSKRKLEVDKTYVKQRLSSEGYIKAGEGKTAVEVYYERFSAYNAESKLTAPQQDDLVKACTDLEKLRTVVEEYSRRPYKARNIKLILEWYSKGIPDNGNGNGRPNSTQSNQQRPANERRALGKAPVIDRNEAKRLFANHPIYANQPQ